MEEEQLSTDEMGMAIDRKRIQFIPLAESHLQELGEWHQDEELARRYGGKAWPGKLWEMTWKNPDRKCWIARINDENVAYVDFEIHPKENVAWIGLAVKPIQRKKGIGKNVLHEFLEQPFVRDFQRIFAGIEEDNRASIRCFSGAGFQPVTGKSDDEGIVDYSLMI